MSVRLNEDKEIVAKIREGLKRKGGHCPCKRRPQLRGILPLYALL